MENLIEVDENWGYPYDLGNLHVMIEKDQGQNMWLGIPSNFEACEE